MANTRKRAKRKRAPRAPADSPAASPPAAEAEPRGYARGRAKDDAARAALKPLPPGGRPMAVTVAAIAAVALAAANLIAMIVGWDSLGGDTDEGRAVAFTVLWSVILLVIAWGMWRSRYWAVLGMQTLLGITLVLASLSLISTESLGSAAVLLVILAATGTLFWFMVKAMARIQMPERPTRAR